MYKLQEPLRGSSVPRSPRSTTTQSGGGSQARDGEKGAYGDARASVRTNPHPTWGLQRHFQSPQGQNQGQACGGARGQAPALFPAPQLKAGGGRFSPLLSQSLPPPSYELLFALPLTYSLIPYRCSSLYPDSLGKPCLALKRLFPHCPWTTKNHYFNNNSQII